MIRLHGKSWNFCKSMYLQSSTIKFINKVFREGGKLKAADTQIHFSSFQPSSVGLFSLCLNTWNSLDKKLWWAHFPPSKGPWAQHEGERGICHGRRILGKKLLSSFFHLVELHSIRGKQNPSQLLEPEHIRYHAVPSEFSQLVPAQVYFELLITSCRVIRLL